MQINKKYNKTQKTNLLLIYEYEECISLLYYCSLIPLKVVAPVSKWDF